MVHDDELKNCLDYSEEQKEAAHRVLIELINLFDEYRDDILIVGGWVPDLMFPGEGHIGSVDVDVLINHRKLQDTGYFTMSKILLKHGYTEHPEKLTSSDRQSMQDRLMLQIFWIWKMTNKNLSKEMLMSKYRLF